jgi:hypothetical protein
VDIERSNAEHASCAPLAIDILPEVDETNCDISPPWVALVLAGRYCPAELMWTSTPLAEWLEALGRRKRHIN